MSTAPALEPVWQRWLAENLLLGTDAATMRAELIARGCPPALADAEIADAEASPYFQAAGVLRARLAKRDWHLDLVARHAALAGDGTVPRIAAPRPEDFLRDFYAAQRPVVLTGLVEHWPALRRWTWGRLGELGAAEVEVQAGREGHADYEAQSNTLKTRMRFADFLREVLGRETNDLYLTANNGGHNRTALAPLWDDLAGIPGWLEPQPGRDGFLWVGPAGTVTPWHHDLTNNLLVQLRGRKRVTLASSAETARMRNHKHCYSLFGGDAEFAGVAAEERPRTLSCEIGPGDTLFIPVGWWHHVRGLEPSISVSFTNLVWPNDVHRHYTTYDQV